MKKLLLFILIFASVKSFSQTVQARVGYYSDGTIGKKEYDSIYPLPRTPGLYFNSYGDFVSLADSVRPLFSGVSPIIYNAVTGAFSLGVVPIANGGTNNGSLSVTAGTIYYGDGTKLLGLAPGTSNQILHGGTTPSWKDTTAGGGGSSEPYGVASGTNTYTATVTPSIASYVTGVPVLINFTNANTLTTLSLNLNSLGAKTIQYAGATLAVGEIAAGGIYELVYDGTNFQITSPLSSFARKTSSNIWTAANTFSSTLSVTGALTTSALTYGGNIWMPSSTTAITSGNAVYWENGNPSYLRVAIGGTNTTTIPTGSDYSNLVVSKTPITLTGTHALFANAEILTPYIATNATTGTIENFQTLYVADRPSFGKRNWSVNAGRTRVRGSMHISATDSTLVPASILTAKSTVQGSMPFPVMTAAQKALINNGWTASITAAGSGYTNNTYLVLLTGGSGTGAEASVTVSGGVVTAVNVLEYGFGYVATDALSATIPGGSGFVYTISAVTAPPVGLHVYQSDGTEGVYVYKSTGWTFAY